MILSRPQSLRVDNTAFLDQVPNDLNKAVHAVRPLPRLFVLAVRECFAGIFSTEPQRPSRVWRRGDPGGPDASRIDRLYPVSPDGSAPPVAPASAEEIAARLLAREAELARVQRIGQVGGLEVDLRGHSFRNRRSPEYLKLHGLPPNAENETHDSWVARIHPEDRAATERHFLDTVKGRSLDYEAEYRIIRPSDGELRWIFAKAEIERDADGRAVRLVGAHIDITERRVAEEQTRLIAQELSHRIKNIFAVINSIVMLSARGRDGERDFAVTLSERIAALGRAHDFVQNRGPSRTGPGEPRRLGALLGLLLTPYQGEGEERVIIEGDEAPIGEQAATALALVIHEFATNAVKYGSLSQPAGHIAIATRRDGENLVLTWHERGGPPLTGQPDHQGFGTMMAEKASRAQLGATVRRDWNADGLAITLVIPLVRLAR